MSNQVKSDMPDNLYTMSDEQLLDFVVDEVPQRKTIKERFNAIKNIYRVLNYDLTNDLKLALLTETEKQLLVALAGGCKTSTAIVKTVLKIICNPDVPVQEFYFLVYNKPNVSDIINNYIRIAGILNKELRLTIPINKTITSQTVHAFCSDWVKEYSSALGLSGKSVVSANDTDVKLMFEDIIMVWADKQLPGDDQASIRKKEELVNKANDFTSAFEYQIESMLTDEEMAGEECFRRLKVSVDDYATLKSRYNRSLAFRLRRSVWVDGEQRRVNGYTHAQSLELFRNLIRDREDVRERIQSNFFYMVIDEVQDLSPLMMDIFRILIPKEKQALLIGDDDQGIYSYRGANSKVLLEFKETFSNSLTKIQFLTMNRRCPENVVDLGREVLKLNEDRRFNKEMKSSGRLGDITLIPYEDKLTENILILDKIKSLHSEGKDNIVVAYRNNSSAEILIDMLKETNIPFNTGGSKLHIPFNYYLYRDFMDILGMCYAPEMTTRLVDLWKCTPFKKQEILSILDLSNDGRESLGRPYSLYDIPVAEFSKNPSFVSSYKTVVNISKRMRNEPVKNYANELIDLILKYRYLFKVPENHDYFVASAREFFQQDMSYSQLVDYIGAIQARCSEWNRLKEGVTFSTFHRLKGLEFDEVILMDLANDIFPNDSLDELTSITKDQLLRIRDENNRLFYVAVTRAKKNLTLFYDRTNPSRFIPIVNASLGHYKSQEDNILSNLGFIDIFGDDYSVVEVPNLLEGSFLTSNDKPITLVDFTKEINNFSADKIEEQLNNPDEVIVTKRKWTRTKFGDRYR